MIESTCNRASARNLLFTKFCQYVSRVKLSLLYHNQSSTDPKIDKASDIARMLSNFENYCEIKYVSLSDVPMSDLRPDSAESTSESRKTSGHSTPKGTINVLSTQDNVGNILHTDSHKDYDKCTLEGAKVSGHATSKDTITGSSAQDDGKSTPEGVMISGDSMSTGTITVLPSQDDVGKVVHTPVT